MFTHAIVRKPRKNFAQGITTSKIGIPVGEVLLKQHGAYVRTLKSLGLKVVVLDALADFPDAYFVEDTAVVTPDVAVITNPGAETRKGEEAFIEPVLAEYRKTVRIEAPGTLDGGDVLMVGKHFFIGISERTNMHGAQLLGSILEEFGNTWTTIQVASGLHLKSSVNYIGKNSLIVTERFSNLDAFNRFDKITVEESESPACNTLLINDHLIMPGGFPKTRKKLDNIGLDIIELDVSEVQKMDGGVTCMSVRF